MTLAANLPTNLDSTSKTRIYRLVRREIIMGHRRPGERLDVEELAQRFDTSITPVRDALQMLSQEGLVTIRPRSGYFVARMTLKQLRDMLDLRKILELTAIERAALRITPDQIEQLRKVHAGYTGDDDESYDRYTDENRRFHYLVGLASGNLELADAIGRLHDRLARFMVLRHAGKSQEITHARIVDALEAHDAEAARRALLDDIDTSADAILDGVLEDAAVTWHVDA
ncbi:MAG: GntR family transcriptional regulator [Anaerolineales bacterium]|jgi:DNA-binding GntR family transcriptional regulator|nr:GntR family transcriptional regulator [Anaerolineales bacterium]